MQNNREFPDYWAEKNIEVYSTTTLKPTYTAEDIQAGEMTAFWGANRRYADVLRSGFWRCPN